MDSLCTMRITTILRRVGVGVWIWIFDGVFGVLGSTHSEPTE